jgi:hypothetical protein
MKTVILKGQKITIGSKVRFIDGSKLYVDSKTVIKPQVGKVYTVRGFSSVGGFYLEEIKNKDVEWVSPSGESKGTSEPGFAVNRFEPAQPLRKEKIVQIKIEPLVEERLDVETLKKFTPKKELNFN